METLKICIATYRLYEGNGIDISVIQFARELAKRHDVTLAAVQADERVKDLTIKRYPANNPLKMRRVAREIARQKFDLISTHYPPFDLVASMSGLPHFLHDPGVPPASIIRKPSDLYLWSIVNGARLIAARTAKAVLPISQYLSKEFRKKYLYDGPMHVLPYCIDFPEHLPEPAELPFDEYVLFVGRHTPYKGVHKLIDIFSEINKTRGHDLHLVTIGLGDPGYMEVLRKKAAKTGNVHMLGFVPDVWPYYTGASVYATCSAWEGQDRPAIEAQFAGKPVVAFNNCSHPEVVIYGSLACGDEDFSRSLANYLDQDKDDKGVKEHVKSLYSASGMVDNFFSVVRAELSGSG
jgi:glycosyltransferase involved in cell wall biosynthesis